MKKRTIRGWGFVGMVAVAAIVTAQYLSEPEKARPDPVVESLRQTPSGPVIGFQDQHNTHAWLGIPYAEPPVSDLRWKAPRPVRVWSETREALAVGPSCLQFWSDIAGTPGDKGEVVGSEDCLTLNIWAPAMSSEALPAEGEGLPVMVWIHGGGNTSGTANVYRGHHLSGDQRVIVVGVNYRLGLMGWFSHQALRDTSVNLEDASGNYGLLDIIASLKWVQSHIAAFGGDQGNVTVFGESAGGRDVYALMASPLAKGLFHKAIVQSGSVMTVERTWAENFNDQTPRGAPHSSGELLLSLVQRDGLAETDESAKAYIQSLDAQSLMAYLRAKEPDDLLSIITPGEFGEYSFPTNIRDGHVLPKRSTLELFAEGQGFNRVPLLVGTNRDEQKVFMAYDTDYIDKRFGFLPRIKNLDEYNRVASYYSDQWKVLSVDEPARILSDSADLPVFVYRFDWDESPSTWAADFASLIGAGHALEISFVFGDFDGGLGLTFLLNEDNRPGREYISRAMMGYWASFARTGVPGQGGNPDMPNWQAWGSSGEQQMVFDTQPEGGVRMLSQPLSAESLKKRLVEDSAIKTAQERCRLYTELFLTGFQSRDFWDEQEFRSLAGGQCEGMDPYQLALGSG